MKSRRHKMTLVLVMVIALFVSSNQVYGRQDAKEKLSDLRISLITAEGTEVGVISINQERLSKEKEFELLSIMNREGTDAVCLAILEECFGDIREGDYCNGRLIVEFTDEAIYEYVDNRGMGSRNNYSKYKEGSRLKTITYQSHHVNVIYNFFWTVWYSQNGNVILGTVSSNFDIQDLTDGASWDTVNCFDTISNNGTMMIVTQEYKIYGELIGLYTLTGTFSELIYIRASEH